MLISTVGTRNKAGKHAPKKRKPRQPPANPLFGNVKNIDNYITTPSPMTEGMLRIRIKRRNLGLIRTTGPSDGAYEP